MLTLIFLPGVGYGALIATAIFSIYFAVIVCWVLFYFFNSFYPTLPWTTCDNDWNIQETCVENSASMHSEIGTINDNNSTTTTASFMFSISTLVATDVTKSTNASAVMKVTSAEQFWKYYATCHIHCI